MLKAIQHYFKSGLSLGRLAWSLSWSCLTLGVISVPAVATETITIFYPPIFEASLSVSTLERFAREGEIVDELQFYAQFFTPEELNDVRDLLNRRFEISHVAISQFTYSPVGERLLKLLGQVLLTESDEISMKALRGALILAAADPEEGLTVINFLNQLPYQRTRVDLQLSLQAVQLITEFFQDAETVINDIQSLAATNEIGSDALVEQGNRYSQRGPSSWTKRTLTFDQPQRQQSVTSDIYLPQVKQAPVVVISHGVASDRNTFAYLGQHLASHGFAVAILEHPGTSIEKFKRFLAGFDQLPGPEEWIYRPLDIRYLLDELSQLNQMDPEWQDQFNLERVGVIGQSFGGYSALATAGAAISLETVFQNCLPESRLVVNLSRLLQCTAVDLTSALLSDSPRLADDRIQAVLAINPVGGTIFGQAGFSQIQIPTMIVAGSNDFFAPVLDEQIKPFTWLTTPNKYLVIVENGTHFSFLGGGGQGVISVPPALIGPDPTAARPLMNALSTAFMKTYIDNQKPTEGYLTPAWADIISSGDNFDLSLVTNLKEEVIQKIDQSLQR